MALKPNPAWRGDPTFLPEVLKLFGVRFRELPGFWTWGMGDFNVIQGCIWHHTGARNTSAEYIQRNAGLSGGLSSQFHTAPDGLQTLCGVGLAWHAGRGSYPGWPTNDANRVSIGFEMQHNGTDAWPAAQLESTRRATAAILWFLGKRATTATMLSHWEYSLAAQSKWDPGAGVGHGPRWANDKAAMMDMDVQRAEVNKLIDTFNKYGTLNPVAKEEDEFTMADIEAIKAHITAEHEKTRKHITQFVAGFVGPIGSDVKDNRAQLTGGRDAGQYPGFPQIDNRTLVDAFAAMGAELGVPGFEDPHGGSLKEKQGAEK